jgi:hypothetical protein
MVSAVTQVIAESAPVHLKNAQYGFLGTLHGNDLSKKDHLTKIVPHAKAALTHALAKHQSTDSSFRSKFGVKTSAQDRRAKMKVTNKVVGHFLDSAHGRHIADALNSGQKHHNDPAAMSSRAHHFMRDYDPSLHETFLYDDASLTLTESVLEEKENHNLNAARSIYHTMLQTKGHKVDSPEYIKLMQDFLAGYKNGSSIAEQYELAEATETEGYWTVGESVLIEAKVSGTAESETHKIAQKHARDHKKALDGTIHNLDHNEDGSSTWHIRHTKPQTDNVVKVLRDVRYAHDQGIRDKAGEVLNSKTSRTGHPSIHINTAPLSGGWYNTQVHFKPAGQKLKEEEELEEKMSDDQRKKRDKLVDKLPKADFEKRYGERSKSVMYAVATKRALGEELDEEFDFLKETSFYGADDGNTDPLPLPDAQVAATSAPGQAMQNEASPSTSDSRAKRLTTESPILDADTDQIPLPQDQKGDLFASGISEDMFDHGAAAKKGIMHSRSASPMMKGRSHSYHHPNTGKKTDGEVVHKGKSEIHMKNSFDGQVHKFKVQDHIGEEVETYTNDILDEEFNSHEQASSRKEYLDKKHPRTMHEVVQGRRSGKYFIVRKNQHGKHVAEAVGIPDLESGGATQTMKTYDDPTKAIGEDAAAKALKVKKIKSIVHSSKE